MLTNSHRTLTVILTQCWLQFSPNADSNSRLAQPQFSHDAAPNSHPTQPPNSRPMQPPILTQRSLAEFIFFIQVCFFLTFVILEFLTCLFLTMWLKAIYTRRRYMTLFSFYVE